MARGSSGSSLWPLGTGGPVVTAEELVPFGLGEVAASQHAGLGLPSRGPGPLAFLWEVVVQGGGDQLVGWRLRSLGQGGLQGFGAQGLPQGGQPLLVEQAGGGWGDA
jgi:hypothetical protein